MTYFEDVELGDGAELGRHTFAAEEIIAFARRWDPQPFHTDPVAAKDSLFGDLCASGWHTVCTWMRLNVEASERLIAEARAAGGPIPRFGPSPGIFDLKWPKPVFVGDTISYRWTFVEKRETNSRPEWGLLTYLAEGTNQDDEPVMTFNGRFFMGRRPE
ncbi:MaoC family dehydratase [Microbaculum marinum]|uniref:MaoC family dehydratase n=1 Tax=Microbaculum marinum TaxID=1764581 RepID=A0AAW9RJ21_9HYPH